jgi:hypothetical protein
MARPRANPISSGIRESPHRTAAVKKMLLLETKAACSGASVPAGHPDYSLKGRLHPPILPSVSQYDRSQ